MCMNPVMVLCINYKFMLLSLQSPKNAVILWCIPFSGMPHFTMRGAPGDMGMRGTFPSGMRPQGPVGAHPQYPNMSPGSGGPSPTSPFPPQAQRHPGQSMDMQQQVLHFDHFKVATHQMKEFQMRRICSHNESFHVMALMIF